jgi:hypothetical protein
LLTEKIEASHVVEPGQFVTQGEIVNLLLHAVDAPSKKYKQHDRDRGRSRGKNGRGVLVRNDNAKRNPGLDQFTQKR